MSLSAAELQALTLALVEKEQSWVFLRSYKYYLKNGVYPYNSTAEALLNIPSGDRVPYMTVNVLGRDYWLLPDLLTFVDKVGTLALPSIAALTLLGNNTNAEGNATALTVAQVQTLLDIATATNMDNALNSKVDKITGSRLIAAEEILAIASIANKVNIVDGFGLASTEQLNKLNALGTSQAISLPAAGGSVSSRCAASTPGIDYPASWVLTAGANPVDLLITHNLGSWAKSINIWSVNASTGARRLRIGNAAYSAIECPDENSILIEALSTVDLVLVIQIEFE